MTPRRDNYIAGGWRSAAEYLPNINPAVPTQVIAEHAQASREQAAEAIAAARSAARAWAESGIQQRFDVLDFVGSELLKRREDLGELLAREEGKTRAEAIAEVARAGQIFKFFAGEAVRAHGESLASVRPGIEVTVTREPMGVVGVITPWNFPIAIPAWKVAPALACGNCVLLKPAAPAPACSWALAEILSRSGLPPGVFNLVNGAGSVVGDALVRSEGVDAISFTGSQATGAGILATASARGAKVQLEMGGKNPLIVLADADLSVAVECAVQGAFYSTGQRCTASSVLIVDDAVHDAFVAALAERTRTLVVGDPLEPHTNIGPVVDAQQLQGNLRYARLAVEEGGEMVEGGHAVEMASGGYFMRPGLVTGTDRSMTVNCEEIFGPLASVIRVRGYDEALATANDTPFGLSSGICTRSLKHAHHFRRHAAAGMVMVNLPTAGVDYHVPFGGRKASSYGPREQGSYAREFFTTVKTAYVRPL